LTGRRIVRRSSPERSDGSGIADQLAAVIPDDRDPSRVVHLLSARNGSQGSIRDVQNENTTRRAARRAGGISAFLVDKGSPGFNVVRPIPMVGGAVTYEVLLEDCRVEGWKLLGTEGQGFAPMQLRLGTRRVQMAAWSIGMAQRALDMICDYAPQRTTFGQPLSQRQAIQWWVADAATKIHAARLMTYDCAWKLDQGADDATKFCAMAKRLVTDTGFKVANEALQIHGGIGFTWEHDCHLLLKRTKLDLLLLSDTWTQGERLLESVSALGGS